MANNVSDFLKYANLQMAAESLFGISPQDAPGLVTTTMTVDTLIIGNRRSSAFTTVW